MMDAIFRRRPPIFQKDIVIASHFSRVDTTMRRPSHYYRARCMLLTGCTVLLCSKSASAFLPKPPRRPLVPSAALAQGCRPANSRSTRTLQLANISTDDQALAFWITAFSVSHIGMSAIRDRLITASGKLATLLKLVDRKILTLPAYWPGDDVGNNQIFPDEETAGRQIYRAFYTLISFVTLFGGALSVYLSSTAATNGNILTEDNCNAWFAVAVLSQGVSIASLFNASPLSLVPVFEQDDDTLLKRNDALKFKVNGLTRITRHPLVLPVIPWGVANAFLLGGRLSEFFLFGGLSLYALAGCAAQDLRVVRKEGSVGTVFRPDESLQQFFADTSFVPFGAVVDGRQSIVDIVREVPWIAVGGGCLVGAVIEDALMTWLQTR